MKLSLRVLNLKELLYEGNSLRFNAKLAHNGHAFSISALGDTGANGFIFIDTNLAIQVAKALSIHTIRLSVECPTQAYDGRAGRPITHALELTLMIDGRVQRRVPMLITDLGEHDLILGRMWFEKYGVLPDCKKRRLIWPEEQSLRDEVTIQMPTVLPRSILQRPKPDSQHQEDADRRDQLIESSSRPRSYEASRTMVQNHKEALEKMNRALLGIPVSSPVPRTPRSKSDPLPMPSVRLAVIGTAGFHRHMKNSQNETFVTTLYEIDRILEEKQSHWAEEHETKQVIPAWYHDYADVFSKRDSDTLPPHRGSTDHRIILEEGLTPGYCPLYKQSEEELRAAKEYITKNLAQGFIEPSDAAFASPILVVRMPDGRLRVCIDYRKLNALTKKDRYPLPLIDEILQRIGKAKFFTKLDIRQGFHRIRMHPDSEDLTTFRTRYGSFKYKVMPFGVTNGPATFQRFINTTLSEYLDEFAIAFVDDILIYSETLEDHIEHVRKVLQRLRDAGLQASLGKCEFHKQNTRFLGFIVSTDGIQVDPAKTAVVRDWEQPTTVRGVQSFLGFCNFYRRFIDKYSRICKPLHRLTMKDVPYHWTEECEEAFQELKHRLATAPILAHYDFEAPTKVETDASGGCLGAVLSQLGPDKQWHPVAFFSKTMKPEETRYHTHDHEMLAIVSALKEWRPELEGLQRSDRFSIFSDHQSLQYFMTTKKLNSRQARWGEFLCQFHFLIRYFAGKRNIVADTLSRKSLAVADTEGQTLLPRSCLEHGVHPDDTTDPLPVEIAPLGLAASAHAIDIVPRLILANQQHDSIEEYRELARKDGAGHWTIENGLLQYDGRLVVPDDGDLRARLLDEIHRQPSTAHPGQEKTKALVCARYYWPGWSTDVRRYVDNCLVCKRTKVWRDRAPGLLKPLPAPDRPWQHVTMDFRSFPKDKYGYDAVFLVVDRLTKRPVSIPCHKTTGAREMARLYVANIYRWVGPPDTIVSDRGPQFISEFWAEFCRILGIKRKLSTAHQPQTDGQSEVANQWMAQRLRPYVNRYQDDWSEYLPMNDFAAAALQQDSTKRSPFFIERGYEPRVSFDWRLPSVQSHTAEDAQKWVKRMEEIWKDTRDEIQRAQARQITQANKHRREEDFGIGDMVFITMKNWKVGRPSRKLSDQAAGPYKIVAKEGNAYRLELPASMKVHPVFSPNKLRSAAKTDPLPGQIGDAPLPVEVNDQQEWEVEEIIDVRLHYRKLQYKVRWTGCDSDDDWYPASDFKNAAQKLADFHDKYPDRPGPPLRLPIWLEAARNDTFVQDHPDDGKPQSLGARLF
jgi:transposase InsO family protein